MAINKEIYTSRDNFGDLVLNSPSYDEPLADNCELGSWSSIFTIMPLSNNIGRPIKSISPAFEV